MQRDIDSREFTEWQAYWQLEPWGEGRADLRAGIIASTLANIHRTGNAPLFTPQDFMPTFDARVPDEDDRDVEIAQQQQLLESLTRAVGGEIR